MRIGAIEYRGVTEAIGTRSGLAANRINYMAGFAAVGVAFDDLARVALGAFGPQLLAFAVLVVTETDEIGVWIVAFKVEDIANGGSAKLIDRLIVVANNTDVAVMGGLLLAKHILRFVGILVFVDEEMFKALLVFFQDLRMAVELAYDLD